MSRHDIVESMTYSRAFAFEDAAERRDHVVVEGFEVRVFDWAGRMVS